jgi:hypothetical protein
MLLLIQVFFVVFRNQDENQQSSKNIILSLPDSLIIQKQDHSSYQHLETIKNLPFFSDITINKYEDRIRKKLFSGGFCFSIKLV